MTRFKSELERVLKSIGDSDTGIILREICDLAAEMGDETAEALLARHPDLFELAKPLAQASLHRLHALEITEVEHLFAQRIKKPVLFTDVASAHAVET